MRDFRSTADFRTLSTAQLPVSAPQASPTVLTIDTLDGWSSTDGCPQNLPDTTWCYAPDPIEAGTPTQAYAAA